MHTKTFLFLIALMFLTLNSETTAQEVKNTAEVLDNAQFRVLYEFSQQADKRREKIILADTMALTVGANWSEYYDWHKVKLDSLTKLVSKRFDVLFVKQDDDELNSRLEAGEEAYSGAPRKPETAKIFKERGGRQIITIDKGPYETGVGPTYLKLTEDIPPMQWDITPDTATVLGYLCTKATTSFRGRTYNAWFTTEIPITEGPWKLYGLPGLILKAETTDGLFRFIAIGLENVENESISFPYDQKITPAKDLKQLYDFRRNERRKTDIILVKGGAATAYMTNNPVEYHPMEIID